MIARLVIRALCAVVDHRLEGQRRAAATYRCCEGPHTRVWPCAETFVEQLPREYACQIRETPAHPWRLVGVGATENRDTAESDFRAWDQSMIDFDVEVRLVSRPTCPWEPA